MKFKFIAFLFLLLVVACQENLKEKASVNSGSMEVNHLKKPSVAKPPSDTLAQRQIDCKEYWESIFVPDSAKVRIISQILAANENLTVKNKEFLQQLQIQILEKDKEQPKLAFEKALSPVFKLKENQLGIFAFPIFNRESTVYEDISFESKLLKFTSQNKEDHWKELRKEPKKLIYYPQVLDSLYNTEKPQLYIYTSTGVKTASIKDLGTYQGECLQYYQYSVDTENINKNDKYLFASKLPIDLVYENNAAVDKLIKSQIVAECQDCPNSAHLEKTFARLKGTDNIYFIYADTFPLNNQLDTPSRGLILRTRQDKIIYLWQDELDLFGCSCL